jgi:peroxiredoxin Q/BCP
MSESTVPQPGDPAPSFRAEASTGSVGLEDFRGKPLVLYFYPKADTGG